VALAAQRLGCKATIVMPVTTPQIKINAVAARGAEVVLAGELLRRGLPPRAGTGEGRRLSFVHPYDDPDVIAGQGTIGMEILRQHTRPIHAIFVPVGGGGLISGIGAYVKRLRPEVKVIGVEPVEADPWRSSLAAGHRVRLNQVGLFADGVAVKQVGEETFRLCKEVVDGVILVDTDAICAAIKDVFEDTRSIARAGRRAEPSPAPRPGRRGTSCATRRWWRWPPAPTPTSTACATSRSGPNSARSARRCCR
jgi:threonine dehydratase